MSFAKAQDLIRLAQLAATRRQGLTLDEIAEKMEVTRERVRQIEGKALRKLRHESRIPQELAGIADVIGGAADA